MDKQVLEHIGDSEIVLIGIGEDFDNREDASDAYNKLYELVKDKRHFVISLCEDNAIYNSLFDEENIVTPLDGNEEKWNKYNKWITLTLNHSLCVLELGVGLKYPTVVRFPFEKIVFVNNKAVMIRVNRKLYQSTEELKDKCIGIKADPIDYINQVE